MLSSPFKSVLVPLMSELGGSTARSARSAARARPACRARFAATCVSYSSPRPRARCPSLFAATPPPTSFAFRRPSSQGRSRRSLHSVPMEPSPAKAPTPLPDA